MTNKFIKTFFVALILVTATVGFTQPAIIEIDIPLRAEASSEGRIIRSSVANGTHIVKLQEEGRWAEVELIDGTLGWVPNRFVSFEIKPQNEIVDALNSQILQLQDQLKQSAITQNQDQQLKIVQIEKQIATKNEENMKLNEQNKTLFATNQEFQAERDMLLAKIEQLNSSQTRTWFIYGAIAVFLGGLLVIIGAKFWPRRNNIGWG